MARKKKKDRGGGGGSWLVTFSDLMTLLLTFFVLLLSMSSMDRPLLTRISPVTSDLSFVEHAGAGKIPDRIKLLVDIVNDPNSLRENLSRIKDLLFPDDILPKDLSPGTLEKNLRILAHPEGVVIVLNEGLLFPSGGAALSRTGEELLEALLPFLFHTNADVNIAGHTDDREDSATMTDYVLSGQRAISVLEYFLHQRLPKPRFSISGYGPDRPLVPNTSEANREQNRRVEILVKTTQWLGRYL